MVNRQTLLALVALAVCGVALLGWFNATSGAQAQPPEIKFENVEVVVYPNGMTGFFDRGTGKLYMYDIRWEKCIVSRQMTQLGEPMEEAASPR
jgi:hypothetical protein